MWNFIKSLFSKKQEKNIEYSVPTIEVVSTPVEEVKVEEVKEEKPKKTRKPRTKKVS